MIIMTTIYLILHQIIAQIIYKMSENIQVNVEKSFFDDKSFYNIESSKKSQNDSSNPEKEFYL